MLYIYALIAVFVISLVFLIGVFFLAYSKFASEKATIFLVSLASGALLGDAFSPELSPSQEVGRPYPL